MSNERSHHPIILDLNFITRYLNDLLDFSYNNFKSKTVLERKSILISIVELHLRFKQLPI